ncbi:SRPBCC domain-containing protein [Pendulispora rubella]|uniref:SRPBCC domain-containing protein n=1 Tax=Pendulispora rubella TaxID=2741070 RepID=A0ABZ2KRT7_9BACT
MSTPKIVLERTYEARIEELWDLWTTKQGFESWWGPEGYHVEVHALEARAGGMLRYEMIADAPEHVAVLAKMGRPPSHETRGAFSEFRPYERLALTHMIDFFPGVPAYESTITVEFFPRGGHVRMVVALDPMHDAEITKLSSLGFTSQLSKLDKRFGNPQI